MKKVFTHVFMMAALIVAGAAFVSCDKENIATEYTMTVVASKGDNGAKQLILNGHTLNATWAAGENVYVKKGTSWATGSLKPKSEGVSTILDGTLSGIEINANDELTLQFPRSGEISYNGQVGTLADIAANFDYATATVTVASVNSGNITTTADANFQNQQAIVKFTLTDNASTPVALSATQLIVRVGTTDYTINPATGTSEIFVALPGFSGQTVTLTATVGSDTYTYTTASAVTFANGQYYEITVRMTEVVPAPAHEYVDLGLPSGLLWATCNVGADNPEDYGDYFAWGETTTKTTYNWSTYQYCMGSQNTLTKYCNKANRGYNGYTDNLTTLLPEDDAATANWGSGWRMPTKAEFEELYNNTTVTWTQQGGVNGWLFTAANSNSLFLPAAGRRWEGGLYAAGESGYYWSSSLYTSGPYSAWYFTGSGSYNMDYTYRYYGYTVRPVREN